MNTYQKPTYTTNERVQIATFSAEIPDHMRYFVDMSDEWIGTDEEALYDQFAFIVLNEDYEGGFSQYIDAPFSLHIRLGQQIPELTSLWEQGEDALKTFLIDNFSSNIEDLQIEKVHVVTPDERIIIGYINTKASQENEAFWRSYTFIMIQNDTIYSGSVWFNGEKTDEGATDAIVYDWFSRVKNISEAEKNHYQLTARKRIYGEYAAANGDIDGVKVAQLFCNDVIFFNDDAVEFDGIHQRLTGLELNADVIYGYPAILASVQEFGAAFTRVVNFIEANENLMIPKYKIHESIAALLQDRPITGISFLTFCCNHMIKIAINDENTYSVAVDRNLINGIPQAYSYITEFIKTLRRFNERTGKFTVVYLAFANLDSNVDVDEPVLDADVCESTKTIVVEEY